MAKSKGKEKIDAPQKTEMLTDVPTDVHTDVQPSVELIEKYDEILAPKEEGQKIEEVEEVSQKEAPEPAGDEGEYENIPEDLVEAARASGLTDTQIETTDMAILRAMDKTYRQLVEARTVRKEALPPLQEEPKREPLKPIEIPDLRNLDDETASVMKSLMLGQNTLIDQLNVANERVESLSRQVSTADSVRQQEYDRVINAVFDEQKSSDFGRSEALSPDQANARQDTYLTAALLARRRGIDVKEALRGIMVGLAAFNQKKETSVKDDEVQKAKLDKYQAKMVMRPSGQKTAKYSEMGARDREFQKFSDKWHELVG